MKIYERVYFINKEKERKCEIKSFREEKGKMIGVSIIYGNKRYNFIGSFDEVDKKINSKADIIKNISDEIDIDLYSFHYHVTQAMITAQSREKERVITYIMWGD